MGAIAALKTYDPSLDSLSGAVLLAFIGRHLASRPERQYSYRLVWVPETVGAVAYAATQAEALRQVDDEMRASLTHPDTMEGVVSFVEKRAPVFAPWSPE